MHIAKATEMLTLLSALAGAVHVMAPDHWVPASILGWQRQWSTRRTAAFAVSMLLLHVLLGFALFLPLSAFVRGFDPRHLFLISLALVGAVTLARGMRFGRMQEVLRSGSKGIWGAFAFASLLGPCESVIPIFVRSRALGNGYLLPFASFLAGTVLMGTALVLTGRWVWNRPLLLPRGLRWVNRRATLIPVAAGLAWGFRLLIRLT